MSHALTENHLRSFPPLHFPPKSSKRFYVQAVSRRAIQKWCFFMRRRKEDKERLSLARRAYSTYLVSKVFGAWKSIFLGSNHGLILIGCLHLHLVFCVFCVFCAFCVDVVVFVFVFVFPFVFSLPVLPFESMPVFYPKTSGTRLKMT
jgi:hypothetical protein